MSLYWQLVYRAPRRLLWRVVGALVNRGGRLRRLLRHHGIVVFVGPNGSGKSLLAVEAMLDVLDGITWECNNLAHRHNGPVAEHARSCPFCVTVVGEQALCPVGENLLSSYGHGERLAYSTLPLLDAATGREHPLYRPLTTVRQLPHIEHADVLFDEVAGVSDADSSASMPSALKRWLQQLRKRDVRLRVTTPAYDRCSLPIRQVATLVVDARSFYEVPSESGRLWRPRLAMMFEAFDAFQFAHFDKNSGKRLLPLARLAYWREAERAMHSYDTLAQVNALVDVEESGACVVCSGSRPRPSCACPPDVHEIPPDELVIVETVGPRGGKARMAVRAGSDGTPAGPLRGAGEPTETARHRRAAGPPHGPPDDTPTTVLAVVSDR